MSRSYYEVLKAAHFLDQVRFKEQAGPVPSVLAAGDGGTAAVEDRYAMHPL